MTDSENGYADFNDITEAVYSFTAEKEGYETLTGKIDLSKDYNKEEFVGCSVDWESWEKNHHRIRISLEEVK